MYIKTHSRIPSQNVWMHDNAMPSRDIKAVTKYPIIFTWGSLVQKIPTQRKASKAVVGTEKANILFLYPRGN